MAKKKLVVLSGAGISKESGIATFRDASDGTWYNVDPMEVAHIDGWRKDKQKVLDFYNSRRRQLDSVHPNSAHLDLAALEEHFDVTILTQNVDDLHERAGSINVLHLHGELTKACSSNDKRKTVPYTGDIKVGDKHPDGSQLRPFIVWFGEDVPNIGKAARIVKGADIFLVIGTSLEVYPAAGLVGNAPIHAKVFVINPEKQGGLEGVINIQKTATEGMKEFMNYILPKDKSVSPQLLL